VCVLTSSFAVHSRPYVYTSPTTRRCWVPRQAHHPGWTAMVWDAESAAALMQRRFPWLAPTWANVTARERINITMASSERGAGACTRLHARLRSQLHATPPHARRLQAHACAVSPRHVRALFLAAVAATAQTCCATWRWTRTGACTWTPTWNALPT
jgi:hypothetical protein